MNQPDPGREGPIEAVGIPERVLVVFELTSREKDYSALRQWLQKTGAVHLFGEVWLYAAQPSNLRELALALVGFADPKTDSVLVVTPQDMSGWNQGIPLNLDQIRVIRPPTN